MQEAIAINSSLSALKDVISAMKEGNKHVPFRNSKLTLYLQDQLKSESVKVLMIVNLNPVSLQESLSSLNFADKVNYCKPQITNNMMLMSKEMQHSFITKPSSQ